MAPLRVLLLIYFFELGLLAPRFHHTVLVAAVLFVASSLPGAVIMCTLATVFGYKRDLPWLPLLPLFVVFRSICLFEGLISLTTRPVRIIPGDHRVPRHWTALGVANPTLEYNPTHLTGWRG